MNRKPHIYSQLDFENFKKAGEIHKFIQYKLMDSLKIGMTTFDLESIAKEEFKKYKAKSAFYKLYGYPYHICVSINNEILHGCPSEKKILEGDVVKIDIGVNLKGYIVDGAFTSIIISTNSNKTDFVQKHHLISKTYKCLRMSINTLDITNNVCDFSQIYKQCIDGTNYYLIPNYMGHGVGKSLHEEPKIPNSPLDTYVVNWNLMNGMVLAIEPMVFNKKVKLIEDPNKWTIKSIDENALGAHFEETIFIKNNSLISLTKNERLLKEDFFIYG